MAGEQVVSGFMSLGHSVRLRSHADVSLDLSVGFPPGMGPLWSLGTHSKLKKGTSEGQGQILLLNKLHRECPSLLLCSPLVSVEVSFPATFLGANRMGNSNSFPRQGPSPLCKCFQTLILKPGFVHSFRKGCSIHVLSKEISHSFYLPWAEPIQSEGKSLCPSNQCILLH